MSAGAAARAVRGIAAVVPARDEQELVRRSLEALVVARAEVGVTHPDVAVVIVLVADSCVDDTVAIARSIAGVEVLEIDAHSVGVARAAGVERALEVLGVVESGTTPDGWWIANTDADSVVPPNWFSSQLELADGGTDVVVGTVHPDFADLSAEQITAWDARHQPGRPNGHVHGANLGLRLSAYRVVGGFAPLDLHEDNDLVARLRASPVIVVTASEDGEVTTSGRRTGRAAGGYADYLATDLLA